MIVITVEYAVESFLIITTCIKQHPDVMICHP